MADTIHVLAILLVAVTMGLALAHALEFPGKMRLPRETYLAVQPIYYPGFALGGLVGEFGGLLALVLLLFLVPFGSAGFWWVAAAFALMLAAHLVYWLVTHPVNDFWLKDTELGGAGAAFFSRFSGAPEGDWRRIRDTWEYSHAARAVLAILGLAALTIALAL